MGSIPPRGYTTVTTVTHPILQAAWAMKRPDERIFARVEARRDLIRRATALEGEALSQALFQDLVREYSAWSVALNGLAALPITLPGAGPWGTFALALTSTVVGDLALQAELAVAVAAVVGSPLRGPELERAVLEVLRVSTAEDRRGTALNVGKRVLLKKSAEKLANQVGTRAVHLWSGVAHQAGMAPPPALARAVSLAMVPAVMRVAWRDGHAVALRARAAFSPGGQSP